MDMKVYFSDAEQVEYHTDTGCARGDIIEPYNEQWVWLSQIEEALDQYPFLEDMIRKCCDCQDRA